MEPVFDDWLASALAFGQITLANGSPLPASKAEKFHWTCLPGPTLVAGRSAQGHERQNHRHSERPAVAPVCCRRAGRRLRGRSWCRSSRRKTFAGKLGVTIGAPAPVKDIPEEESAETKALAAVTGEVRLLRERPTRRRQTGMREFRSPPSPTARNRPRKCSPPSWRANPEPAKVDVHNHIAAPDPTPVEIRNEIHEREQAAPIVNVEVEAVMPAQEAPQVEVHRRGRHARRNPHSHRQPARARDNYRNHPRHPGQHQDQQTDGEGRKNEVRRLRIKCEIEQLAAARERIAKIRDDEERVVKGLSPHGDGAAEVVDALSEVGAVLLAAIGKLDKARK